MAIQPAEPHTTTEESDFKAAKALPLAVIEATPDASCVATADESPPELEYPQVTTEESDFSAANASLFAAIETTPDESCVDTAVESPP